MEYGPINRGTTTVETADGSRLIKDAVGMAERWTEHYFSLLNRGSAADMTVLEEIP